MLGLLMVRLKRIREVDGPSSAKISAVMFSGELGIKVGCQSALELASITSGDESMTEICLSCTTTSCNFNRPTVM